MFNCKEEHFCDEFWGFFRSINKSPAEYYNVEGIGEATMRRVVFDCDRCGKKDIGGMAGLFDQKGESAENLLPEELFQRQVEKVGYRDALLVEMTASLLHRLSEVRSWNHYCDRCFGRIVEDIADVAMLKKAQPKTKQEPVPETKKGVAVVPPQKVVPPAKAPVKAPGKAPGKARFQEELSL